MMQGRKKSGLREKKTKQKNTRKMATGRYMVKFDPHSKVYKS